MNSINSIFSFFSKLTKAIPILLIFLLATNYCFAQNMSVPENIQAALLPKVLKFSSNHLQKPKLRMIIVYDHTTQISKDEFIKGLASSIEVIPIHADILEKSILNCDIVYFMPGLQKHATYGSV